MNENILNEFTNAFSKKPKFFVKGQDGGLKEIKEYSVADVGVQGTFYVHKQIIGSDYALSERKTGLRISTGATKEIAIGKGKAIIADYIAKNGIDAFYNLIKGQQINEDIPVNEEIKAVEEIKVEEPVITPPQEETINTALISSLNYMNCIDVDYIADLLKISVDEVRELLLIQELAFVNPENEKLETNEEYLSGNVREKLRLAEEAFKTNHRYERNVNSLKEIIPETIPAGLIQYSLGAAWIPLPIFEQFAHGMFKSKIVISYMASTGKFSVQNKGMPTVQIKSTYAAGGKNGVEILNATMNNQQIIIHESIGGKQVKNIEMTSSAQQMQEQMQEEFIAFVRADKNIEAETEEIYNEIFNSYRERDFWTPELKHYPNANPAITPMDHQKRGVARAMSESTLFAHEVGLGKSILIMITALELRRLGLAKKPMIAVQNKTIGQFITKFRELYPNANLLYPSESDLTAFGKPYFYERIRDEDFDAVIFPQSQFDAIPDDIDRQLEILDAQMEAAEYVLMNTSKASMPFQYSQTKREIRALQRDIDKLTEEKKILIQQHQELSQTEGYKPLLTFEQMGVDALLLDEFHRWKRLGFSTSLFNIKGIDTAKSARSQSCLLKMRWVQQNNGGRNTFGYTGTPISNTMAEAWTMIRYFRPDILVDLGIQHFDQFAKTFGQIVPSLEQTGGGTFKIQNRFAKFQNLPEFVAAFRKCTDVVFSEDVPEFTANNILPKLIDDRIDQVIVKRSQELVDQIAKFKETLEWYEALEGMMRRQYSYIPLVIFNRAKQASIDLRLLNPTNRDNPLSKVNQVIRKAFIIYEETQLVQMIFCDLYQSPEPKSEWLDEDCTIPNTAYGMPRFNLFNDIKEKLISMGVKPSEIVIMNEAKYDKKERAEKVFEDANAGRIKFLLGSTEKMGVGVNVQKKLYWLHHVDAPARPMDFGQRNGRIIRPFNLNPFVGISAYGTERTLDSAAFQRLAIKQAFINQILKGENLERVTEDAADEALMTFNEMMAHLSDSPYAQQKLLIDNRLKSERLKRDNFYAKQQQTNRSLVRGQEELERLRLDYEHQTKYYAETFKFFPEATITELKIGENVYLEGKGTALNEYMDFLIDRMRSSPTKVAMGMFFVNGAKVSVKMEVQRQWSQITKEHYDAPALSYTIPEIGIFPNAYDNGVSVDSCSGSGMLTSIRWKIDSIISRPKETEKKIKQYEVTIEELERTLNVVYDLTRLEELEAEVEVIKDKMMNEVIVEEELI